MSDPHLRSPSALDFARRDRAPAPVPPAVPDIPIHAAAPPAPAPIVAPVEQPPTAPAVAPARPPDASGAGLSVYDVIECLRLTGHELTAKPTSVVVTNASTLTAHERQLIADHKADLLVVLPAFHDDVPAPSLVRFMGEQRPRAALWTPDAPPSLSGIDTLAFNIETAGLDWQHNNARALGVAISTLDEQLVRFLPFGFRGQNLDEVTVKRWAQTELRGKHLIGSYVSIDAHFSRTWGVDLVEQGCTFSDVQHYAALLDDHRKKFGLDTLVRDMLHTDGPDRVDERRMADYEAQDVAERAEFQVRAVARLRAVMWPMLDAQRLQRVRQLEDDVIRPVIEMEKNGARIDVELLHQMDRESRAECEQLWRTLSHDVGFPFDGSDAAFIRVFEKLDIPLVMGKNKHGEPTGKPTFKDAVLERIEHPTIKTARYAQQLESLRSKIFTPYCEMVGSDGKLWFALNQLRGASEKDGSQAGTVSGRFSAPYIQQVPNAYNHSETFGDSYYPRRLFIADEGLSMSADAAQIEYRLFAIKARNPKILAAYDVDPRMSFHKKVFGLMEPYNIKGFNYDRIKKMNFMRIYGGQLLKTAAMCGFITDDEADEIKRAGTKKTSPKLEIARRIEDVYNQEIPEVAPLLQQTMHIAMSQCNQYCNQSAKSRALHRQYRHQGYVTTMLNRRARFPDDYKIHKALNSIIQGTAADLMKTKLVELFNARHDLGLTMRMTIHDEVCGDVVDVEAAQRVSTLLNTQSYKLRVPILWEVGTGANWAEAK